MLLQFKTDEFGILLIGALVFFIGLTAVNYYVKQQQLITAPLANVTNKTLLANQFLLDGLEKKVTLFEGEGRVYKSLFSEKKFYIKVDIPKEELSQISKMIIFFESEKKNSKLYLVEKDKLFLAKSEYFSNEIKQRMDFVAAIEDYDFTYVFSVLYAILFSSVFFSFLYIKYHRYRDRIVIIWASITISLLVLLISLGNIRIYDNVRVKIYAVKDFANKIIYFSTRAGIYNVSISFNIGSSIRTDNLRIYLNNDLIYNSRPFGHSVSIYLKEVRLGAKNSIRFETSNAMYEIKDLYLVVV